ncbi:MAG: glucose-1-phosphate adenylyltransferase subunit GlgD [Clostridiales bacterium]|nr:glucose-1-phosphate adenylyltransferase subunit GlgD [Clostridiales bacterium]
MSTNAFGLIYTGDNNPQLKDLTSSRSIAATPFGGRYRCIDFILSNLVNSGISSVGLITQKNYHSLMDHLGSGKEWDLNRKREGLFILPPFLTKGNEGVYRGSVDALRSVLGYVRRCPQKYCILTGSHTIFNIRFNDMLQAHIDTGADITILYNEVPTLDPEAQNNDLRLILDADERVQDLELNPYRPKSDKQSCDVFILDKNLLEFLLEEAYARGDYDFYRDILLKKKHSLHMRGYKTSRYVARLDSLMTYFTHSMDLLRADVAHDLFDENRVFTKVKDEVPARYGANARVANSILADGCVVEGQVENSLLFRGVRVAKTAVVRNSIIMQGVSVGEGAVLDHVILDKGVTVGNNRMLTGYDSFPIIVRKNQAV